MKRDDDKLLLDRRDALRMGLGAAAALGAIAIGRGVGAVAQPAAKGAVTAALTGPGHVVCAHKPGMRGRMFPYPVAAREAVHAAVAKLAGDDDLGRAFGRFVSKEDRVGIKINVLGGCLSSTTKEIDAIVEGVRAAGVPDASIMIFDQYGGNMRGARYVWQEKPGQLRVLNHDVLGYEESVTTCEGGGRGKLAKTLTWCTAVIN